MKQNAKILRKTLNLKVVFSDPRVLDIPDNVFQESTLTFWGSWSALVHQLGCVFGADGLWGVFATKLLIFLN